MHILLTVIKRLAEFGIVTQITRMYKHTGYCRNVWSTSQKTGNICMRWAYKFDGKLCHGSLSLQANYCFQGHFKVFSLTVAILYLKENAQNSQTITSYKQIWLKSFDSLYFIAFFQNIFLDKLVSLDWPIKKVKFSKKLWNF